MTGSAFPAFLKLAYQPDDAPKSAFLRAVDDTVNEADRRLSRLGANANPLKEYTAEVRRQLDQALIQPNTARGGLDVGVAQARAAAEAAQARAAAARELAAATALAAKEEGDYSQQARLAIVAAQAQAVEEEEAARAAISHAAALEQVQERLDRHTAAVARFTSATTRSSAANDNFAGTARNQQIGLQQLGFQVSDLGVQLSLAASSTHGAKLAFLAFGQQFPQIIQALTIMRGSAGGLVGFLGGPWGAAIVSAASVLGTLALSADKASSSLENVKFSSSSLSDAQGILGNVLDIATGKVNAQSQALIALARAQILVGKVQASARAADARRSIADSAEPQFRTSGGLGGGFAIDRARPIEGQVASQFMNGVIDTDRAVKSLERLRQAGKITDETFASLAAAYANYGVELANQKVFADAEKLLNGTGGRDLLKPTKPRRERTGKTDAERAAEAARKEAEAQAEAVRQILTDSDRQREVTDLITKGRQDEADALQLTFRLMDAAKVTERDQLDTALARLGITKQQTDAARANLVIARQAALEQERQAERQRQQLEQIAAIRSNVVQTIFDAQTSGLGALGGFLSRLQDDFGRAMSERLTDKIFGNAFKEAQGAVTEANVAQAKAALAAAEALANVVSATDAPGSNTADGLKSDIVVIGRKLKTLADPSELYGMAFGKLARAIGIDDDKADRIGKAIGASLEGSFYGRLGASFILGSGGNNTGASIGGALGSAALKKLAPDLFKSLGDFGGPIGGAIGGLVGGLLGKLFGSTKAGYALVTNNGVSSGGNSTQASNASSGASNIQTGLNSIAKALGTSVGGYSVSIGSRSSGWISVSASGSSQVADKNWKKANVGGDLIYDGKDMAEALKVALKNAIQDGAIVGIRAGTQRLLAMGNDIDAQLQKAVDFEGVFTKLKSYTDPVGAALDQLNKEFSNLKTTFAEAGASAAEYADLEKLYGIERANAIKQANAQVLSSLQSLYDNLTIGDSGLSLRARTANAKAAYDPLAARVAAGDKTAYEDFAAAAQTYLELQRQMSGSTQDYFTLFNQIETLTKSTIDKETAIANAAANRDSPFSATSGTDSVVSAIDSQTQALIEALGGVQSNTAQIAKLIAANRSPVSYAYVNERGAF